MSRRIENHEILERGLRELNFSKSIKDTRKRITPRETRQNLLLTAPILISATILIYGVITMETTSVENLPMALFQHFLPFFCCFSFLKLNRLLQN